MADPVLNPKHIFNSKHIVIVLFFLSGFASLTYQVAWQRVLTQTIGADAYSIVLIVAIFMLGLGLGGLLGGRMVRRLKNLMVAYAITEIALGLFGFFSVALIRQLSALLAPAVPGFAIEFLANFALLCVPTILMGMTLPLIVHFVRASYPADVTLGAMYAANIAGAAIGTLVTGFLLIGTIGLSNTCRVIALTNFVIGGSAIAIGRRVLPGPKSDAIATTTLRGDAMSFFLLATFATGFVALGYEIVFFRVFTAYFGMVSYVFPLLLFSYLACMTAGTWAFGRAAGRFQPSILANLAVLGSITTTMLILLGPSVMLLLHINQERLELERYLTPQTAQQITAIVFMSMVLMIPIGFISGLFPVLVQMYNRDPRSAGSSTGTVYFTQTMGNFLGAALTGLVLLPVLGTINTLRLLGLILAIVPVILWAIEPRGIRPIGRSVILTAIAGIFILSLYPIRFYSSIHDFYDAYRFGKTKSLAPAIIKENAIGATLAYPIPSGYLINIGRERTTPLIVHAKAWEIWPLEFVVPLVPKARRALIIGIGPGMHLPVLEHFYPDIKIDVVELNPALIELTRSEAEQSVREGLERANVYLTDGRRFVLKNANERYDIIQIGLNNSSSSGAGNLYTREFTSALRRLLAPDGVLTMNADAAAVKSLLDVFANIAVVSPGVNSTAGHIASEIQAEGSGARVTHLIAWNEDEPKLFRDRMKMANHYPAVLPLNMADAPITVRPNWLTGCIMFSPDINAALAPVKGATDDLPVTEYFLTQRETISGIPRTTDSRIWGKPKGCLPLGSFK